jgi:hypothetical protein
MRRATGRGLDDVAVSVACLLAYRGITDPTAEQMAGAGIEAAHYLDTHLLLRAWTK